MSQHSQSSGIFQETADKIGVSALSEATLLDACGLDCPLPLLKAKQALNKLPAAALLKVLATDSGSQRDFATFAKQSGHELLASKELDGVYHYLIRKVV